jgi:hypothetical protein
MPGYDTWHLLLRHSDGSDHSGGLTALTKILLANLLY